MCNNATALIRSNDYAVQVINLNDRSGNSIQIIIGDKLPFAVPFGREVTLTPDGSRITRISIHGTLLCEPLVGSIARKQNRTPAEQKMVDELLKGAAIQNTMDWLRRYYNGEPLTIPQTKRTKLLWNEGQPAK